MQILGNVKFRRRNYGRFRSKRCRVNTDVLRSVAPTVDELRLLSHVRQVNPSDKENCGNDDDGWFSVIMANRVLSKSKNYHACLVSLEGRHDEGILPVNVPLNYTKPSTSASSSGMHIKRPSQCLTCSTEFSFLQRIKR